MLIHLCVYFCNQGCEPADINFLASYDPRNARSSDQSLYTIYIFMLQRAVAILYYIHTLDNTEHGSLLYITYTPARQHLLLKPLFNGE